MSDFVNWGDHIDDRGKTQYFHGRDNILNAFRIRLKYAADDRSKGTTFLIQAAPGAGKSALLHECAGVAEKDGWKAAEIPLSALWDVPTLLDALGRGEETKKRGSWSGGIKGRLGVLSALTVGARINYKSRKITAPRDTIQVLQSGEGWLVLLLDEAQVLAKRTPGEHAAHVTILLDAIHNGKLGRPVMLAVAGLSSTKEAFRKFGVSRFKANCYAELGPLKPEAERKVIADWLQMEGLARGDIRPWMEAIRQETHGWPQHIASYAQPAALQVRADRRRMTPAGLEAVLETGRDQRAKYYRSRLDGLPERHRQAIAQAFAAARADSTQTDSVILDCIQDVCREPGEAQETFDKALAQGVIDNRNGRFVIPVPSMHDWLLENYGPDRGEFLPD